MQEWWKDAPVVGQSQDSGLELVYDPGPSTSKQLSDTKTRIDISNAPIDRALKENQLQDADDDRRQRITENVAKRRDEYNKSEAVSGYLAAIPLYASGLQTQPNAVGDNILITAIAKVADPSTGVNVSESRNYEDAAPYFEQKVQELRRQLDPNTGKFPDKIREQMREELHNLMAQRNRAYLQERKRFRDLAASEGLDIEQIIGRHAGEAYREVEAKFLKREPSVMGEDGNLIQPGRENLTESEIQSGLEERLKAGQSLGTIIKWLSDNGRPPSPDEIDRIAANIGYQNPDVRTYDPESDLGRRFAMGLGGVAEGVGNFVGLVGNPLNAGINAIAGTNLSTDLGETFRDATGLPKPETDSERLADTIVSGGTSALGGAGVARAGANAATGAVQAGLERFAAAPAIDTIAGATGSAGSETARQSGYGPAAQIAAGLLAGGAGAGAATAGSRLARVPEIVNAPVNDVAQAAARQGVDLLPADVGGATTKVLTSASAQAPISAGPIVGVAQRSAEQMGSAISRNARAIGNVLPEDEAGLVVRKGAELFSRETSTRIGRQYDRAYEMAEGVRIETPTAVKVIDDEIARKSQAGEMSGDIVDELRKVRRSLAQDGGITPIGIREARSVLGSMAANDKLRGTDAKRIFGLVLDAASQDMETGLIAAGKEGAARLFKRADALWKARVDEIDEVLEPIVGKGKSGEDILRATEAMATGKRGGVERLSRMMRAIPEAQRRDIQATITDRMGRAKASAQDDTGTVFSPETFLTTWNNMSPKGRSALFPDPQLRANLTDIAKIASAKRDTFKWASKSNSPAGIVGNVATLASTGFAWGPAPIALLALQYGTGRLLASPGFTRALAKAPQKSTPTATRVFSQSLSAVAAREPALANDIAGIQARLAEGLSSPGRLAASPNPAAGEDEDQ